MAAPFAARKFVPVVPVIGVTAADAVDAADVADAVDATTEKVYATPFVSPVTVHVVSAGDPVVEQVFPSGCDVTV